MDNYKDNSFTLQDMASQDPTPVSLYNAVTTNEDISKVERLAAEKQRKLEKLTKVAQNSSLEKDTYSVLEDGSVVSNENKIFNELSDNDYRDLVRYSESLYALTPDQENTNIFKNQVGETYTGPTRRFYGFNTRDNTNQVYKPGVARGDLPGAEGRYVKGSLPSDPSYGFPAGPMGVDVNQKDRDVLLPSSVATMLEAVGHGRKSALDNRLIKDKADDPFTADQYGSGYSEYYKTKEGFFGVPNQDYNEARGKELFDQYINIVQKANPKAGIVNKEAYLNSLQEEAGRAAAKNAGFLDRAGNAIDAIQRTLGKEVVVDFADWVGEGLNKITGGKVGWDIGTEEEKTKMVNDYFGFNPYMAEGAYNEASKRATNIVNAIYDKNKDVDYKDVYELVKIGFTTPEMLGDSIGFIGSFFVPFLGWGGKAAKAKKVNETIAATEAALKAGQITKDAAKVQVKAALAEGNILNKTRIFAEKNAGLMQVAAGNVNDQIDDYRKEFGEGPSVGKVAQMMATETLMLSLDRWADLSILKSPAAFKGVRDAFSALPKEGKAKLAAKTVGVAAGLAANMGKEAAQEYLQEIGQQFNVKFNFDDNDNFISAITEAGEVLLDKEVQTQGVMGAGLGAGGAVQFAGLGAIPKALGVTSAGVSNVLNKTGQAIKNQASSTSTEKPSDTSSDIVDVPLTPEQLAEANLKADTEANKVAFKYAQMFGEEEALKIDQSADVMDQQQVDTPKLNEALKTSGQSYADIINEIEAAEVVINARKGTDREKKSDELAMRMLRKAKFESSKKLLNTDKPLVLGSGFSPEDVVENYIDSLTTSEGKVEITEEDKTLVNNFLKKNGQKPYRFGSLAAKMEGKDASAVYQDSMGSGANSAVNRRARLRTLLNTPGASLSLIDTEVKGIKNFLNTQRTRKQEFEAVRAELQKDIDTYNKAKGAGKAVPPKGRDFTYNGQKQFLNPEKGPDGKYRIEKQSQALLDSIDDTIDHLETTLIRYNQAINSKLGVKTNESFLDVPVSTTISKGAQEARENDKKFYDSRKLTKAIVDEKSSPEVWKKGKDYYNLNESKIASVGTEFTVDDVVLLTTLDIKPGSQQSKILSKAIQAGATIVVDRGLQENIKNTKAIRTLAKKYGAGAVKVDGISVWKPRAEAIKISVDQRRKAKEKRTKDRTLSSLIAAFDDLWSGKGRSSKETRDALAAAIEKAKVYFDKEKSSQQIRKYVKNTIAKEAVELEARLQKIMLAEGTKSKAYSEELGKATRTAAKVADKIVKAKEARLSKGGTLVAEWKKAQEVAKKGGKALSEWVKETFGSDARSIVINMLSNSMGKANKPEKTIYSYKVKGKNEYRQTTKFEELANLAEDGIYHVIEVDPSTYVEVGNSTVLNTLNVSELKLEGETNVLFNEFVETALEELKAVISPVDLSKKILPYDLIDSPLASFIFDKDNNLNANFAVATKVALYNFVRNNAYMMSKEQKTEKDIAEILGKHESELSEEAIIEMQKHGLMFKTAADSVGKDIASLLGLKAKNNPDVDVQAYNALITEMGQVALIMGTQSKMGLLETTEMDSGRFATKVLGKKLWEVKESGAKINFIGIKDQSKVDEAATVVEVLNNTLPGLDVRRREPFFSPLSKEEKDSAHGKIKKERLGLNVASKSKEAMDALMDTEMIADMPLLRLVVDEKNKMRIMSLLGWVDLKSEDFQKLSFKEQQTQASKNRDIERNFEHLEWLNSNTGPKENKVSMWFKYFFSKNGRFFVESNTINFQTNKQLDRFLVQPKDHWNTYSYSNGSFKSSGKDVTPLVHYALAQAFGFATDKKSSEAITEFATNIIKNITSTKELNLIREDFLSNGEQGERVKSLGIKIEHLGHALQGFDFVEKMLTSPAKFESPITAEFDAVTSGFALKLLQMPIIGKKLYDWLGKVGVFTADNSNVEAVGLDRLSMNNMLSQKNFLDSYQFLASSIKPVSYKALQNNSDSILLKANEGYAKDLWNAVSKVLPTVDPEGGISSELRSLFKYPFMTFNYASSVAAIRSRLKGTMQDEIAKNISKVDLTSKTLGEKEQNLVDMLLAFAETTDMEVVKKLQEEVRKKPLGAVRVGKGASLGSYLDAMIDASYGVQVEEVLNNEFAPFVEAQEAVNNSFKAMFEVFKISFEEELLKARKNGVVSAQKEKEIYESLKDKWPAIKGPLSDMEEEFSSEGGIGVYSTETASPYGVYAGRKAAVTRLSPSMQKERGAATIRTSHMIKALSSAISAGAVIPIHYIDGAVMANTILNMGGNITTIHDAVMPSLLKMDEAQQAYNRAALEVNGNYSFVDQIVQSLDRIIKGTPLFAENSAYEKAKVAISKTESVSVAKFIINARNTMAAIANTVSSSRKSLFETLNKGGYVMHMAGTTGGVYTVSKDNPVKYASVDSYSKIEDNTVNKTVNNVSIADLDKLAGNHC